MVGTTLVYIFLNLLCMFLGLLHHSRMKYRVLNQVPFLISPYTCFSVALRSLKELSFLLVQGVVPRLFSRDFPFL